MISYKDEGKTVVMLINRETADFSVVGKPLKLLNYEGTCTSHVQDMDTLDEMYVTSHRMILAKFLDEGLPFRVFIHNHAPFTIMLPKGSIAARIKHLRSLFSPSTRIEVVKGSTRNNIKIRMLGLRARRELPGWELVALNIGEVASGAVHEEKRRVRGAYPGASQSATKAGRRDRAPRRKS